MDPAGAVVVLHRGDPARLRRREGDTAIFSELPGGVPERTGRHSRAAEMVQNKLRCKPNINRRACPTAAQPSG